MNRSTKKKMTALDAVWVSANTSYRNGPTREEIKQILQSGMLPERYVSHINYILTETPRSIVESAALEATGDPAMVLANIKKLENALEPYCRPTA